MKSLFWWKIFPRFGVRYIIFHAKMNFPFALLCSSPSPYHHEHHMETSSRKITSSQECNLSLNWIKWGKFVKSASDWGKHIICCWTKWTPIDCVCVKGVGWCRIHLNLLEGDTILTDYHIIRVWLLFSEDEIYYCIWQHISCLV